MCKVGEQTIHMNTIDQYACGECSSSPVFKNANSNLKGQRNVNCFKGIIRNSGKGVLK